MIFLVTVGIMTGLFHIYRIDDAGGYQLVARSCADRVVLAVARDGTSAGARIPWWGELAGLSSTLEGRKCVREQPKFFLVVFLEG